MEELQKITYKDKVDYKIDGKDEEYRISAKDMNEIKHVFNNSTEAIQNALRQVAEAYGYLGDYKIENGLFYFKRADGTYGEGINLNVSVEEFENIVRRVTSLETNGVAVGDTLKIGSQVVYDGDDIPTGWKEVIPPFSNPNLLINGDMRVWQRGESFTGNSSQLAKYTADRWLCVFATGNNVLKAEDGTGLVYQRNTTDQSVVRQYIELDTKTSALLVGKKVTMYQDMYVNTDVTIKYGVGVQRKTRTLTKGNNIITDTFLLTEADIELKGGQKILDYLAFSIGGNEILSINLRLAKLEIGELATPFVPRSYVEELQLCQWYYIDYDHCSLGDFTPDNGGSGWFMLNAHMRIAPSIKGVIFLFQPNTNLYAEATVKFYNFASNTIMFVTDQITYNSNVFTPNQHVYIYNNRGFALDAEIY